MLPVTVFLTRPSHEESFDTARKVIPTFVPDRATRDARVAQRRPGDPAEA